MKNVQMLMCVVALSAGSTAALAQSGLADGQVTKVDVSAGNITIKSGPIKKLDMEAMIMVFHVQDPDMLKAVNAGDKIKFDADLVNGQYTVTKIEKSK